MKKIFGILMAVIAVVGVLGLTTKPTMAAKPDACATIQSGTLLNSAGGVITTGYDEWGYNYQAHMFNGKYCDSYRDAAWCQPYKEDNLIMKWNDAWLSNKDCDSDGKLDRHYGFPTYIGSGAWLTNHQSGTYQDEIASSWNVTGKWLLDFAGGTDNREFRNLVQDELGDVVGEFWWFDGANWLNGGTLVGNVTGNILTLHYDRAPILYTGDFVGTIGEEGITDGAFVDSHGNDLHWTATGPDAGVYDTCSWNYFVKIVAVPSDAVLSGVIWYTADGEEIGPSIWGEFAITQEVSNDACAEQHGLQYKGVRPGLGNW